MTIQGGDETAIGGEGQPGGGEWAEESAEALGDLVESGLPPTGNEMSALVGDVDPVATRPWGFSGIRWGNRPDRGSDLTGRMRLDPGPWRLKARWKSLAGGGEERGLAAGYESRVLSVQVGHLGFQHGYGLLFSGPGRTPSLSADQGLRLARTGSVAWTGTPDDRTYLAAAAAVRWGNWQWQGMVGTESGAGIREGTSTVLVRMEKIGKGGSFGVGVVSRGEGRAVGVTGSAHGGSLVGNTEFCAWRPSGDGVVRWAGMATIRWQPIRVAFLEAGLAGADGREGWGPGHRPTILPGWSGRGYVLRGGMRTPAGLRLRALVHQGMADSEDDGGEGSRRRLLDIQAGRDLSGEWEVFARLRRTSWTRWDRPERHPWLPAEASTTRLQTVVSLTLKYEREGWRNTFLVRTLGQETPGDVGRRTILSHAVRGRPGRGWTVRGFLATAWGDDVDLVTAVVPLSGLVLSRHWGRWRSETGGGLGWSNRGVVFQVAGGYRRAEPGRGELDRFWVQFSFEGRW